MSSPKGPLMCTSVGGRPRNCNAASCGDGMVVKVTSGGIDKGAEPIFERDGLEVAKVRREDDWGSADAGRRNRGTEKDADGGFKALKASRHVVHAISQLEKR